MAKARKKAPNSSSSVCGREAIDARIADQAQNVRQVERAGRVVEPQDRHQHQDRAEHRVQNEFHRGVDAALVAPHADHEIHRDQHQFPEDEEEEQIERDENADHGRLDHQQRDEEALHVFVDRFPGAENGDRREERGEQDEKQADAVHAEVVVNGLADPVVNFLELIARRCRARSRAAEAARSGIRRSKPRARCGESRRGSSERSSE